MEYTKRRRCPINVESKNLSKIYQHDVQMYNFRPNESIPVEDFQDLCLDRLKLLQYIESNGIRTDFNNVDERKQALGAALSNDGLKYFAHILMAKGYKSTDTDVQYRRKDHISHFILRLAYCTDINNYMWYINQELEFFKLKISSLDRDGLHKFIEVHKLGYYLVLPEEKDQIREDLRVATPKISNVDTVDFYKVPFTHVIELVRWRKVYLSQGLAYIPKKELLALLNRRFEKTITDGTHALQKWYHHIDHDERLLFLSEISNTYNPETHVVWNTNTVSIDLLDELSKTSYPLCMRILHEALRTKHHLKHGGRMQYGLFIKGIGVTLEDSLEFWKSEFTKVMDVDKFEKLYGYNIRHNYGREGKQTDYTPYGCTKIISSHAGPDEHHGCPFKQISYELLKQKLLSCGISPAYINEIAEFAKSSRYHLACQTYFKALHNQHPERPIFHPNAYFMDSQAIFAKRNTAVEFEKKERFRQSTQLSEEVNTPNRSDRNIYTPSKAARTPLRTTLTPSRNSLTPIINEVNTPTQPKKAVAVTPVRAFKGTPKRMDQNHLNDEEIAELMNNDV